MLWNQITCLSFQLINKTVHASMSLNSIVQPIIQFVTMTYPFHVVNSKWISRQPIPLKAYNSMINVFSFTVWIFVIATLFLLAMLFGFVYFMYQKDERTQNLAIKLTHPMDFVLLTYFAITEPDPLPWFPRWSSGIYSLLNSKP